MTGSKEMFMQLREESSVTAGLSFEHLIDAKKANLQKAIETITNEVSSGNYDSLKGLILALKGKSLFTDLEKSLRPLAENDYLYKIEKGYSMHDVSIDQAATSTSYDFTNCNDEEWNLLNLKSAEIDKAIKERETFLKSLTKPLEIVNTDTGETSTINPPIKLQKQGLKLTIK